MSITGLEELDARVTDASGTGVEVGFRPSGELHIGNLVSIASAAVIAGRHDEPLQVTCCDTDWAAHTHELVREDNKRVMKHYFARDDPEGCHDNLAKHRYAGAEPYIREIASAADVELDFNWMSDLQQDSAFREALHRLFERMEEFDAIWDGGFRKRWKSPVAPVCECGFSPAKGASYASESRTVAFPCWNDRCGRGFAEAPLAEENRLGIYYLVDPIRDTSSRDTKIHVFGGDYRHAEKGQKTTKLHKVRKITELVNGETPLYVTAPLIVSSGGKPLSKSKNTGIFLSELPAPGEFVPSFLDVVEDCLVGGEETVVADELVPG
ncbi:MAG: hypothetical protein SVU32_08285 [Candidatus Nanohaloarchaea archaeon]|nr:hypothetical protein [Candidatus Nanohaloarchaea archaeon]